MHQGRSVHELFPAFQDLATEPVIIAILPQSSSRPASIGGRPRVSYSPEDGDEEDEDSYQEDSITTSSYSSGERDEDWKISSLGTESDLNSSEIRDLVDRDDVWELSSLGTQSIIAHLNSPDRGRPSDSGDSFYAQSEWQDSLDRIPPPAPQQWRCSWDWRYCPSCQGPYPSGELKRLRCIEVGLKDMRDCHVRTAEEGQKRERED
ncbi:hypothetical protein BDR05DRAFT_988312 [Suillus weaverae]|nr:hypothetical protein BDR05DRAFT_988312 [Suillus weaverae]